MLFPEKRSAAGSNVVRAATEAGRRSGNWDPADIDRMVARVAEARIPGDFAEIGVFRGEAFQHLVRHATAMGRQAHAFDSFRGMAEPSLHDGSNYPKGKFDVGGVQEFEKLMQARGISPGSYRTWPGYIPDCFSSVPGDLQFSLVILDVDHYEPTVDALNWMWPRISPGGLLALDDFIPRQEGLATKAIKEFLRRHDDFDIVDMVNNQLILSKLTQNSRGH